MVAAVKWYSLGYRAGAAITDDVSGNLLQTSNRRINDGDVRYRFSYSTLRASPSHQLSLLLQQKVLISIDKLPKGIAGVSTGLCQQAAGRSLDVNKVTTLQDNLNQLIPGLLPLV